MLLIIGGVVAIALATVLMLTLYFLAFLCAVDVLPCYLLDAIGNKIVNAACGLVALSTVLMAIAVLVMAVG